MNSIDRDEVEKLRDEVKRLFNHAEREISHAWGGYENASGRRDVAGLVLERLDEILDAARQDENLERYISVPGWERF